ncbi:MAG: GDSL-type esterase/lipase family protein, partial [Burkholderiales bacterium]
MLSFEGILWLEKWDICLTSFLNANYTICAFSSPNRFNFLLAAMLKTLLVNFFLVLAAFLIAGGVGEVYFRFFDPQPITPRYVESTPYGIRKNIGDVRGEMVTPEYRHNFSTNSQGFRGTTEYNISKPAGIFRVLVLGDSVTLGHGVEDGGTFSAVLGRSLSRTRPTEVINMGVSGFGTAEELIQLREVGLQYQPDVVVVAYFQNDPYNNMVAKLFSVSNGKLVQLKQTFEPSIFIRDNLYAIPGYNYLCQHSHIVNFLRGRASGFFLNRLAQQNQISTQTSRIITPVEAELTGLLLNEVESELERKQIPLIVLNVPLVMNGEIISNLPLDRVAFKEPQSFLLDLGKTIYLRYPLAQMAYEKDVHPTPLAHGLIGEELAKFIQAKV